MALLAVIDDSYHSEGTFVLAGYIASPEAWENFTHDWEELLPLAVRGRSGRYRFKMAEMAATPERFLNVPAFFRVIDKHLFASLSVKINANDLSKVQSRIFIPGKIIEDWEMYGNKYFVAFRCLMDKFHIERKNLGHLIPDNEKIDFIFDNQRESAHILKMWPNYIRNRPDEIRKYYGNTPVFRDDEEFIPLQAADFRAWWVRKWYAEGTPEKIQRWQQPEFCTSSTNKHVTINITFDENDLMQTMTTIIRNYLEDDRPILDLRGLDNFRTPKV